MADRYVDFYSHREVPFRYRGLDFRFALSQELFSSQDIDRGSRLLLKALSRFLDETPLQGGIPLLDAGAGIGVLGICAAGALRAAGASPIARLQDRDDLARRFSLRNARGNGLGEEALTCHTEPLLDVPPGSHFSLILSNVPAKAGLPVLEDLVPRSLKLLSPGGRVFLVVVRPLAALFRGAILRAGALLLQEEASPGHSVFVYGCNEKRSDQEAGGLPGQAGFLADHPAYLRWSGPGTLEGISFHLDTFHSAPGFDAPGGALEAGAALLRKTRFVPPPGLPLLIHEGGQGQFPLWLISPAGPEQPPLYLSGRNIISLEAARHNLVRSFGLSPVILPSCGLFDTSPPPVRFGLIASFPERAAPSLLWPDLERLLAPGGGAFVTLPSSQGLAFERGKPRGFIPLGNLKREGFRALAWKRSG